MIIIFHTAQKFLERMIGKSKFITRDLEQSNNYLDTVYKCLIIS